MSSAYTHHIGLLVLSLCSEEPEVVNQRAGSKSEGRFVLHRNGTSPRADKYRFGNVGEMWLRSAEQSGGGLVID